jgi:hypothetical protein
MHTWSIESATQEDLVISGGAIVAFSSNFASDATTEHELGFVSFVHYFSPLGIGESLPLTASESFVLRRIQVL